MAIGYQEWCDILGDKPLPAAMVDLSAFDRNLSLFVDILRRNGSKHTLRLATKSVRVPALIKRVLDAGPPIQGLMCYAVTEAAFLAQSGFDDLLVAYPTLQPSDLHLARQLHEDGVKLRLMVDSFEGAERISRYCQGLVRPLELVLDLDMSLRPAPGVHLGVRRSPVRTVSEAVRLFQRMDDLPNVRVRSAMGYEAQVAGLADRNPFKRLTAPILSWVRWASIKHAAALRGELVDALRRLGIELDLFNGGGSGSIDTTSREPWLTETTIGSGLLCSHLFSYYSNVSFEPACFFALQVVRSSDSGYATCLGGGYIASGEPGWDRVPVPYLPQGLKLVPMEGCGEVQTPLVVPKEVTLTLGDPVLFRHAKAGELAEHFNNYLLVEGGRIIDEVPTYRGLGHCFLG